MRKTWFAMAMALMTANGSNARAADQGSWRPVLPTAQSVVFVDEARTQKSGGVANTWTLFVISDGPHSPCGQLGTIESQERFDCDAKVHQTLSVSFISTSGNLIHRESNPGQKEATPANEVGEYIMKAACNGEFASGDVFTDKPSAMAFGKGWSHSFTNPPPVMARSTATMRSYPPPPTLADLSLPNGRLGGVGGQPGRAAFIDLDHVSRDNDGVAARIFWVYAPGSVPDNPTVTQLNEQIQFNCRDGSYLDLGGLAYDASDTLVIWLPRLVEVHSAPPSSTYGTLSKLLCASESVPTANIVVGHTAAVSAGQRMFDTWAKGPSDSAGPE